MKFLKNKIEQPIYQKAELAHLQNLIWSNSYTNDLLALEIVRNRGLPEELIPVYTLVVLTTETNQIKTAYLDYLESILDATTFNTIKTLKFSNFTKKNCQTLSQVMDINLVLYTHFKRTGQGASNFLRYGSTSSPLRAEMFELYLDKLKEEVRNKHLHQRSITRRQKIAALTLPPLSLLELLKALTINYPPLKKLCFKQLEEHTQKLNSLDTLKKGSIVHIMGNTVMKKTDIKAKLKTLEIGYTAKYTEKVTHVLIGKNPKGLLDSKNVHLKLFLENQLQTFFSSAQPKYLEQAAQVGQTNIEDNLSALLTSPDANNVLIAIEMLKTGGVPPNIMEDLLVIQKTNADSKVRAAAKKLLELYAPVNWLSLVQDKQHFAMIHKKIREQDINIKLHRLARNTSRQLAAMLSIAMFKIHRRGLRYVLYHFKKPHQMRTEAFQAMMNGTHCNYSTALGFTNLKERTPDNIGLYKMKTAATFPVDLVKIINPIESIDFHNCKYDKLHQGIGKFIDLKHLDCSCNLIRELPKTLHKLQSLETLDLSNNVFETFPMEVLSLPNLKKLDLRYMHDYPNNEFYQLEIPEETKTQMPNCEILL